MSGHLRLWLPIGAGLLALAAASTSRAEGCQACQAPPPPCHTCQAPPPPCNDCRAPNHQIYVPGVVVTPPVINVTVPGVNVNAGASASASASATAVVIGSAGSSSVIFAGGGGSSWYADQGQAGYIPNLNVEAGEARPICITKAAIEKIVAVQAVCLDDKSVPHPASQVLPERDVAPGYEGEVYRCIAGARMQYTLADFAGSPNFDHGQTLTCQKGEALYHSARGGLECRPQRPARDCNERSLLRRYGAGIKVLKVAREEVCKVWSSQTIASHAGGSLMLDGGVGGIAH